MIKIATDDAYCAHPTTTSSHVEKWPLYTDGLSAGVATLFDVMFLALRRSVLFFLLLLAFSLV